MRTTLFTLLVGVAWAAADQSALASSDDGPITELEDDVGASRMESPQVVLQLKYDKGELNKIYLAQFRKQQRRWEPSVPARNNLCADLCHAGLGGEACGTSCSDMLPVGLQTALLDPPRAQDTYGEPRTAVCPTLCENHLGEPLCNCSALHGVAEPAIGHNIEWSEVCGAFCVADGYTLGGCPACESVTTVSAVNTAARILNTQDGWLAWCSVQCRQGHGGAACNCDRSPLQ